ncbi:MAG: host-nuclease inhibitor Gam family protein [Acetatifactor sp.]|nr:host-nuclease inhibitor Gam family protein [Acetatifactor sp.]
MKRVRMEQPELKTWDDVNEALRLIAEAQNEIAMMEAGMNVQIDTIKQAYEEKVQEYKKQIKQKELLIKEFTTDKRDQLDGKTKDLTFGKVGFRKSTKLQLPKALDKVIAALRKRGMEDCISVKETVNKDILKQYDEQRILEVGGSLKVEDAFWYETKQAELKVG